jgi:hypothetical protein
MNKVKRFLWCDIDIDQTCGGPLADEEFVLASEYDALAAELAAATKDAERYRWLRDPSNSMHPAWNTIIDANVTGTAFDAAIDAAMGDA